MDVPAVSMRHRADQVTGMDADTNMSSEAVCLLREIADRASPELP